MQIAHDRKSILKALAAWLEEKLRRLHVKHPSPTPKKEYAKPSEKLEESIHEIQQAMDALKKANHLSEKKKSRAYKALRKRVTMLIEMEKGIIQSGMEIKYEGRRMKGEGK